MSDQREKSTQKMPEIVELSDAELESVAGGDNNNNNNNSRPPELV